MDKSERLFNKKAEVVRLQLFCVSEGMCVEIFGVEFSTGFADECVVGFIAGFH